MAVVLTYGASMPVVKVARIAGQYAKPRSSDTRLARPAVLPRRHGQLAGPDPGGRGSRRPVADGPRLRQRQRGDEPGARADRRRAWATCTAVHDWNQEFVRTSPAGERYEALAGEIDRGAALHDRLRRRRPQPAHRRDLRQPRGAGARLRAGDAAAGRSPPGRDGSPSSTTCPAHFLWVGERTRQLDGAHIAFAELIANPIGVKIGPTTTPELAVEYVERLDPHNTAGPADAGHPDGQRQGPRRAAADRREGAGLRPSGDLAVRPDARQHPRVVDRLQDPALRPHRRRGAGLLRGAPRRWAPTRAASTSRSPARTSPSASAARRRSPTTTWPAATRRPATRG